MLCDYAWLCACCLFELIISCLFAFALNVFTLLVLIFFFFFFFWCQKIQKKNVKSRKSKSLIDIVEFCLKTCFALYLYANGFVHLRA